MYDNTVYTEPDGSKWWRIFHHANCVSSGTFKQTDDFANGVYYSEDKWFEVNLAKEYDAKEFIVKQKLNSDSTEQVIRFTQTVNPMDATYNDVRPSSGNVVFNTSAGYIGNPNSKGGIYHSGGGVYISHANNNSYEWWGGIGAWDTLNGGIPAMQMESTNEIFKTGYIDVYMPAQHIIGIEPSRASLSWRPSTTTAQLTDESDWTASSNAQWLTVSPASGEGSENPVTLTFTATQNDTGAHRTAIVTITDDEQYTETFTVTQGFHGILTVNEKLFKGSQGIRKEYKGSAQTMKMYKGSDLVFQRKTFSPTLSVTPDTMTFKAEDAPQTAQISTNTNWTATTSAQWLTLEKSGNTLTVTPANYSSEEEDRTATVTITASNGDIAVTKTIAVTQKKYLPYHPVDYIHTVSMSSDNTETYTTSNSIDTGIVPTTSTRCIYKGQYRGYNGGLFGYCNAGYNDYRLIVYQNNKLAFGIVQSSVQGRPLITYSGTLPTGYIWDVTTQNYSVHNNIDGLESVETPKTFTTSTTIKVPLNSQWFQSLEIWEGNELVFNGHAALDENDVPSIYDEVSEQYFTNSNLTLTYEESE